MADDSIPKTQYRITNEVLGTTIFVDELPKGVRVGVTDIGPSWNNRPPPKLIVEEVAPSPRTPGQLQKTRRFGLRSFVE